MQLRTEYHTTFRAYVRPNLFEDLQGLEVSFHLHLYFFVFIRAQSTMNEQYVHLLQKVSVKSFLLNQIIE